MYVIFPLFSILINKITPFINLFLCKKTNKHFAVVAFLLDSPIIFLINMYHQNHQKKYNFISILMSEQKPFSSNLSQTFVQSQNNQMTQSRFIRHSRPHSHISSDVMHSFFHDNPLGRFHDDLRIYKPVRYEPPTDVDRRSFVIVDQKVRYGDAITKEQLQRRLNRSLQKVSQQEHEIITYGRVQLPPYKPPRERQPLDVKVEGKKEEGCCGGCCGYCATCCGEEQDQKKKQKKGAIKLKNP